jgi:tRNA U34 2-thiouridine synthase MnmA/TrmU
MTKLEDEMKKIWIRYRSLTDSQVKELAKLKIAQDRKKKKKVVCRKTKD